MLMQADMIDYKGCVRELGIKSLRAPPVHHIVTYRSTYTRVWTERCTDDMVLKKRSSKGAELGKWWQTIVVCLLLAKHPPLFQSGLSAFGFSSFLRHLHNLLPISVLTFTPTSLRSGVVFCLPRVQPLCDVSAYFVLLIQGHNSELRRAAPSSRLSDWSQISSARQRTSSANVSFVRNGTHVKILFPGLADIKVDKVTRW